MFNQPGPKCLPVSLARDVCLLETASLDSKFLSRVYPENGDDGRHYDYICDDEHYEKMIIYIYTYFNDNDLVGWVGLRGDYG